jgi:DNA-directed RNA polymerase specialized sigma24 family protein
MSCVNGFFAENYDYLLDMSNRYVGREYGADLLNDLAVTYIQDSEKYEPICERGELMKYAARTMAICGFSKTSPFYYKYKKHTEKIARRYPLEILTTDEDNNAHNSTPQVSKDEQIQDTLRILEEIKWFDAEVFKSYYLHDHSLKTLSDATGIPKNSLHKAIQAAKEYLQKNSQRIRGHHRKRDTPSP